MQSVTVVLRVAIVTIVTVAAFAFPQNCILAAEDPCLGQGEARTELGARNTLGFELTMSSPPITSTRSVDATGLRYFRAMVEVEGGMDSSWQLIVRDSESRIVQTFDKEDFKVSSSQWTRRLPPNNYSFELGFADHSDVRIRIPFTIRMPSTIDKERAYYSRQNPDVDGWKELYSPKTRIPNKVHKFGDNVGLLIVSFAGSIVPCSGIAIPPDLFLTNWHCGAVYIDADGDGKRELLTNAYWKGELCKASIIDMSFDGDEQSREFQCAEVLADEPLDYALLRIRPLSADRSIGRISISRRGSLEKDEDLFLVHHPLADIKQISAGTLVGAQCRIVEPARRSWKDEARKSEFSHRCDTEGGSSGAPVFDRQGNLIGLHHLGFEKLRDGSCDKLNKAVSIGPVLLDLEEKARADAKVMGAWQSIGKLVID